MAKRTFVEHPEAKKAANLAWDIKTQCEDLFSRALTPERRAALTSITGDLERIKARLAPLLEAKPRAPKPAAPAPLPAQQTLGEAE